MALTESIEYDKIEVVGKYKHVQVRKATIIKKDNVQIAKSFHRTTLCPDEDISGQPAEVQAICNAAWTDAIKSSWATYKASLE